MRRALARCHRQGGSPPCARRPGEPRAALSFTLTGLPALVALVGFVVVLAAPVWLAARLVGAKHPTLLRAILALAAGTAGVFLLAMAVGPWVVPLAPLAFLLAFQFVLGTSFLGSVLLAVLAGLGYVALAYFGGGMGLREAGTVFDV